MTKSEKSVEFKCLTSSLEPYGIVRWGVFECWSTSCGYKPLWLAGLNDSDVPNPAVAAVFLYLSNCPHKYHVSNSIVE